MNQIDLQSIKDLITNEIQENIKLEYKRSEALGKAEKKIEKLSISVSSFANSAGGRLIIGIKEYDDQTFKHLPEKITPINIVEFPKEWIEQIINDNIYPRIANLKITPVKVENNNYVYVIDVPKSDTAHQAKDFKYYKRHNFRKLPMQDYEIRDVLNRNKVPKIECYPWIFVMETKKTMGFMDMYHPTLSPLPKKKKQSTSYDKEVFIYLSGKNTGKKTAQYCKGSFFLPKNIYYNEEDIKWKEIVEIDGIEYIQLECSNKKQEVLDTEFIGPNSFKNKLAPSTFEPVIPLSEISLCNCRIKEEALKEEYKVFWELLVDEARPHSGNKQSNDFKIERKKY